MPPVTEIAKTVTTPAEQGSGYCFPFMPSTPGIEILELCRL